MKNIPILQSKKFQAALVAFLVALLHELVPALQETDLTLILAPFIAYILGQGLADFGKEKEVSAFHFHGNPNEEREAEF